VADRATIGTRRLAEDTDRSRVGTREADDGFDGRRLPGSVPPDQSVERAGFNRKRNVVQNVFGAERALEMPNLKRDHTRSAAAMLR